MIGQFNPLTIDFLPDTGAQGGNFIHPELSDLICRSQKMEPTLLEQPIGIEGYDGLLSNNPITHAIYPVLRIDNHIDKACELLITRLGSTQMIMGSDWMEDHEVKVDVRNRKLIFDCLGHEITKEAAPLPQEPKVDPVVIGRQSRPPLLKQVRFMDELKRRSSTSSTE